MKCAVLRPWNGSVNPLAASAGFLLSAFWGQEKGMCVTKCKSVCLKHSEAKQYRNIGLWSRERFITGSCKEMIVSPKPQTLKRAFGKPLLKVRQGRGMVSYCKFVGVGSFVLVAIHIGQVTVFQQNKCSSLFCNFLSKNVILFKVTALRIGYPEYFRL